MMGKNLAKSLGLALALALSTSCQALEEEASETETAACGDIVLETWGVQADETVVNAAQSFVLDTDGRLTSVKYFLTTVSATLTFTLYDESSTLYSVDATPASDLTNEWLEIPIPTLAEKQTKDTTYYAVLYSSAGSVKVNPQLTTNTDSIPSGNLWADTGAGFLEFKNADLAFGYTLSPDCE